MAGPLKMLAVRLTRFIVSDRPIIHRMPNFGSEFNHKWDPKTSPSLGVKFSEIYEQYQTLDI